MSPISLVNFENSHCISSTRTCSQREIMNMVKSGNEPWNLFRRLDAFRWIPMIALHFHKQVFNYSAAPSCILMDSLGEAFADTNEQASRICSLSSPLNHFSFVTIQCFRALMCFGIGQTKLRDKPSWSMHKANWSYCFRQQFDGRGHQRSGGLGLALVGHEARPSMRLPEALASGGRLTAGIQLHLPAATPLHTPWIQKGRWEQSGKWSTGGPRIHAFHICGSIPYSYPQIRALSYHPLFLLGVAKNLLAQLWEHQRTQT